MLGSAVERGLRDRIEENEPHEPNRGRSDNRSSLTALIR